MKKRADAVLYYLIVFFTVFFPIHSAVANHIFTEREIIRFSSRINPDLLNALISNESFFEDASINTKLRVAHFFAQVATETGGIVSIAENMNYSVERLLKVFSRDRVTEAEARRLVAISPREAKERAIANWVYGEILENRGRNTDDGWNYRGSGFLQLTGRGNFQERQDELEKFGIRINIVDNPELARQPYEGVVTSTGYWKGRNINSAADRNDSLRVRILVNGPKAMHYDESLLWLSRAKSSFAGLRAERASLILNVEEYADVQQAEDATGRILARLSFLQLPLSANEGQRLEQISAGLRAFQQSEEIPQTGRLDEETLYRLTDPQLHQKE